MVGNLGTVNNNQLAAINCQGLDINKNHVSIQLDFKSAETGMYFDPTTTTTAITLNGNAFDISNLKVMSYLSRKDDTVGVWGFEFLTDGLEIGTWNFTFTGSATGVATVTHSITLTMAETPVEQYFVSALRAKLGDKRASRYLVDDNMRTRWTNGELYSYLDDARMDIGNTPPNPQDVTFAFCYSQCHQILLLGGFIFALEARGIFETFNAFGYTDELSLQIDRKVLFQNAQSLRSQYDKMRHTWKRDKAFHDLGGGLGMASGRFPLYMTRQLSLLPNMGNVFYG